MNKFIKFYLLSFLIIVASIFQVKAQTNSWSYLNKINFPIKDSIAARPYLCTVDQNGRLYVISSKVDDNKAHNAIFYADPGDTVFKTFVDYDINGDSDSLHGNIGALRGITTINNDVVVVASQPYPKTKPNTVTVVYYYKNADTASVEKFGFGISGSGYGSYDEGAAMSKDSMLLVGIDFGTSIRWYNFGYNYTKSPRGSWNTPDTTNTSIFSNATEPGGSHTNDMDIIRDVALVPGGNYYNTSTPFYTSRNSVSSTQQTGGIAVWTGGSQVQPINYIPSRVTDFNGFLSFINYFPYGITVDTNGILWVAGIDSTRKWVKGFKVDGVNAIALYDLPSKYSKDILNPNGAPMVAPCDVALNDNASIAYVIDHYAKCAFKFEKTATDVRPSKNKVSSFTLKQNYPNPFNPSTMIEFSLSHSTNVKLIVSDILGRKIKTLVNGKMTAGNHVKIFSGNNLPSGIYFYTLITPTTKVSKKMILLK